MIDLTPFMLMLVMPVFAGENETPWKPTSESLSGLVREGYSIIDTNVVVPATGSGVTVEVIYLKNDRDVYRCLTRHTEGRQDARHRCDRLKRR